MAEAQDKFPLHTAAREGKGTYSAKKAAAIALPLQNALS